MIIILHFVVDSHFGYCNSMFMKTFTSFGIPFDSDTQNLNVDTGILRLGNSLMLIRKLLRDTLSPPEFHS